VNGLKKVVLFIFGKIGVGLFEVGGFEPIK